MTWYTTGTISVTNGSPTVYGTGTLWVDTGTLNAGDITLIGSSLYQVQSIQSNTQLTLSSNFLGTTASGASYAIIPIGLLPSALAQQVKTTLASASSALTSAVLNTPGQAMTSTQQLNARQNIAALGAADVGQGYVSLSVAGNTNVALSSTQAQASIINLTGTLTGNINVSTSMTPRLYIVENATTGAFTVTFIGSSGTGAVVPQGGSSLLFCDGTNIYGLISFVGSITELSGGLKTAHNTLDDGSGNVGIGKANPAAPVDVVGTINASGSIFSVGAGSDISTGLGAGSVYSVGVGGNSNVYKGFWWQLGAANQARLWIGNTAATSWINPLTVDTNGNLLVGTTSTAAGQTGFTVLGAGSNPTANIFKPNGSSSGSAYFGFYYNAAQIGSITQTGTTSVAYNTTSDKRLKTDLGVAIESRISELVIHDYEWKSDGSKGRGVFAQEAQLVIPEAVKVGDSGEEVEDAWQVDYSRFVPDLILEVQALRKELNEMKAKYK